jgi:hypothetical protein
MLMLTAEEEVGSQAFREIQKKTAETKFGGA